MKVIAKTGKDDLAMVYVAQMENGKRVEFVESVQPPLPRGKKWVLIVSTLYGCPVGCRFCDAGDFYRGNLSRDEIFHQIDYLVERRFSNHKIPVEKFKIQFARMGEPSLNHSVLDVLKELPQAYSAPGLIVSLSTIAPEGTDGFFQELLAVKRQYYRGRFQFQFSIHTTDNKLRDWLMPVRKWDLTRMAEYGKAFLEKSDRKIALNFALAEGMPVDPGILLAHFPPEKFLIKITPVNPTYQAVRNKIASHVVPGKEEYEVVNALKGAGYEVILSIGELEENLIGSNCGQYINHLLRGDGVVSGGYVYPVQKLA